MFPVCFLKSVASLITLTNQLSSFTGIDDAADHYNLQYLTEHTVEKV